jgi:phage terminase large subunit GpA-like protein
LTGNPGDIEGEGDPVNLATARTRTFARRKILHVLDSENRPPMAAAQVEVLF